MKNSYVRGDESKGFEQRKLFGGGRGICGDYGGVRFRQNNAFEYCACFYTLILIKAYEIFHAFALHSEK